MKETEGYYIKDVARITGLSEQVIRKWEDRYGVVRPVRKGNGYRVYGEEEIRRLLKVQALRKEGHPLKRAAELAIAEERTDVPQERESGAGLYVRQLIGHGEQCKEAELERVLRQAHSELGLARFLDKVVIPFLKQVGGLWEQGEWGEYQESVSSLIVRDLLVNIRRNVSPAPGAPLIIGACFPEERHELPVHLILLKAMMKGYRTHLVGASPAPGAIESIVQQLTPDAVLLSASTTAPFLRHPDLLEQLDRFAGKHPETRFYAGGTGALLAAAAGKPHHIRVTDDIGQVMRDLGTNAPA
ncbi:hypothetical protein AV656_12015 [Bhargavaea cecembensis]|uniref:HTH merR-type domain-containing protein n=1 Tax=Bhargavaea cecembensis TaxID=394098 RepID=A0A161RGZ2_9BACL|nr:MerR family transcriptional regulator [Bhargavaea cecembensis]KZE37288.1 hypothetical protein AV656_12015 [Bhargavaea cecembensis]